MQAWPIVENSVEERLKRRWVQVQLPRQPTFGFKFDLKLTDARIAKFQNRVRSQDKILADAELYLTSRFLTGFTILCDADTARRSIDADVANNNAVLFAFGTPSFHLTKEGLGVHDITHLASS